MEGNELVADKHSGPVIANFAQALANGDVTTREAAVRDAGAAGGGTGRMHITFDWAGAQRGLIHEIAKGLVVYVRDEGGNIIARSLMGSAAAA
jgi:hypothetical protein